MKQKTLLFLILTLLATTGFAQKSAYSQGDNLLNIGIGVGSPFFGSGYSSSLPVNPSVSFEHGVTDVLSIGGQVSYASSKYSFHDIYLGYSYEFKETAVYIGARGSYHFNEVLQLPEKWDLYGGASLGYVVVSASDDTGYGASSASAIGYGLYGGGKYYFSGKSALFAEVGYQSLALLNVGISFRL